MSMAGVSQDPCINSSDDQDDTMRNSAHSHTHAAHGPLMPAQIHVPPLSLNSGGSGTPSSQQVNPNVSWVHFDSSTTAGRQADAQSGWVPPVSPKGGGIGGLGAVESTIAGAPVTSWALRPEVLVTRARASSAGTDANAGKPPVGLVAPTPILQGFASLLQGLYATPAAREAILSVCPPDARAEDVDNFWRGEAPSAKTSAQAREQVGEQQQPETMDEATNVSAGSQQQDPVAPKISVNAEEGDAFAAETSDVVMECVASDSPTAQARVAIDGEAEKQPGPGAQTTITTADAEADAGMDTGGEHQEQREVGSLITRAADSIIVLQRIQTLFAYMQTSNRAWVQISDVAAVLQFHAQEALSRSEGPADVVRYLFAVVAQAFRDTSLLNARLQLKNDDQISEEMESQRQAAEKIDSFKNELDFVFTSTGGRTLCYEAHTDLPDRIESTPTLYLHPDKLHSSISLAFRQTLSQGNFLIHRPARVMLFLLDHTSRGDKFEYDDPLFIDQLLWEKRKGAALPVVHPQEMQKLHQEEQVARAESLKLAQFKGQDPLQLLESSIEYFDTLSQGKGDPETSATGMNVLESLRKMLDGLKSARRELESKMDTAKQKQEALERKLVEDFSETAKQPQWQFAMTSAP
ncbi:hypothetical protein K437DRAFT_165997 [Tilletiaria anomala UBC 951]|uniref:Uncharacterized protein n=1 Tax=Tilletiaria anomala (strain ATCC 24038 / CBS 436.72 / UBC 951) TaxID=1037660 RepID=A0A066VKA5_TILAU|nr:uncharacterized protein K437DRAFT_165997 [Tilletiaria anomala UBC 951]KDN42177.1 hypothetical protein K437DRAFT_165997 [Tilletiaria anomala UBC 951]